MLAAKLTTIHVHDGVRPYYVNGLKVPSVDRLCLRGANAEVLASLLGTIAGLERPRRFSTDRRKRLRRFSSASVKGVSVLSLLSAAIVLPSTHTPNVSRTIKSFAYNRQSPPAIPGCRKVNGNRGGSNGNDGGISASRRPNAPRGCG